MAASHTLNPDPRFPVGTELSLYAGEHRRMAPGGAAVATATVAANRTATFTGLAYDTRYTAAATVNGTWLTTLFTTETDPGLEPATVAMVEAVADDVSDQVYLVPRATGVAALDVAAAQAVVDQIEDDDVPGAILQFRGGTTLQPTYKIGTPGIVIPTNLQRSIHFRGLGKGGTKAVSHTTRLERTGAWPVISAAGAGVLDGEQVQGLGISHMTISGGNFAGKLLDLRRCSDVVIESLRLVDSADYGLYATQAWNWSVTRLVVNNCGVLNTTPSTFIGAEGSAAAAVSNTVKFSHCTWEGNPWVDVEVDGNANADCAAVTISDSKCERAVGYAIVWGRSAKCAVSDSFLYSNGANGVLKQTAGNSNSFHDNRVELSNASATSAVRVEGGNETGIEDNRFVASAVIARAIHITNADITTVDIGGNTYQGTWTERVTDARTSPRGRFEDRGRMVNDKRMAPLASGESTISRLLAQGGITLSTQALRLSYFTAEKDETVASVRYVVTTTAAGATPTLVRYGVYEEAANGDLTLIASTANDTALLAATNTGYTKALSASFTKQAGKRYALAVLVVTAAAAPVVAAAVIPTSESNISPRIAASVSGQADLPSSISAGSLVNSGSAAYAVCLP